MGVNGEPSLIGRGLDSPQKTPARSSGGFMSSTFINSLLETSFVCNDFPGLFLTDSGWD